MAANATIPERGIIAAVFVMVYSIFCLSCGFLLVAVLYLSREKFSCEDCYIDAMVRKKKSNSILRHHSPCHINDM